MLAAEARLALQLLALFAIVDSLAALSPLWLLVLVVIGAHYATVQRALTDRFSDGLLDLTLLLMHEQNGRVKVGRWRQVYSVLLVEIFTLFHHLLCWNSL